MKLKIGISPCPNDTFIFDALLHHKIDTKVFEWELFIADVEELNRLAFAGELDIIKVSYHAFLHLTEEYKLLRAGSALGDDVGPLAICLKNASLKAISDWRVAIPGKYTTAHLLFSLFYPEASDKREFIYSDIEQAIVDDEVDVGVIIHENRFTYKERGFQKIADLGSLWFNSQNLPIPLGGIIGKKSLGSAVLLQISDMISQSLRFARNYPNSSRGFVEANAMELSEVITRKHIDLYVNKYSEDLDKRALLSIENLFDLAKNKKIIKNFDKNYLI